MKPTLFYVGLTHQSAPLCVRENVRADAEKQRTMLARLGTMADGRLVLCTCERFEVYATTTRTDPTHWSALLSQWFHVPAALLERHLRTSQEEATAGHLLRVAAGLESRIVGESQILGQVRDAFQLASGMNALDAELSMLGRSAIRTGKRVRHETALSVGCRSIATIALDALTAQGLDLRQSHVVVVGTGRLAEVVAAEVSRRRAERLVIVGRNEHDGAELAGRVQARFEPLVNLRTVLGDADVAITCTTAPTYLIDAAVVSGARCSTLRLIDLSVPRNVDPFVTRLPNVRLTHLDELVSAPSIIVGRGAVAPALGPDSALGASGVVQEELERFLAWRRERRVAPMIARLCQEAEKNGGRCDKHALHERIVRLKAEAVA